MSRSVKGFTITLEKDINEETIEAVVSAISMFKGVSSVKPVMSDVDDHINRQQIKCEYRNKFLEFYKKELKD